MKAEYIKTGLPAVITVKELITVHYFEYDRHFTYAGESHNFWEFVYADSGAVEIRADEKTFSLNQGEIYFHQPNEFHAIKALDSAPCVLVLSFTSDSKAMQNFAHLKTTLTRDMKKILKKITEEAKATFDLPQNDPSMKELKLRADAMIGGQQLIKIYLEEFFITLLRTLNGTSTTMLFPSKDHLEDHLVLQITEYYLQNLSANVPVSAVCEKFGYGSTYLEKLFKQNTGYSLAQYFTRLKIKEAKKMIREGELNFSQIADALSFFSPQYFCRVFKRVTRMSPTEYKKSIQV